MGAVSVTPQLILSGCSVGALVTAVELSFMLLLVILKASLVPSDKITFITLGWNTPIPSMFCGNVLMDQILAFLFFVTNMTNKTGVTAGFMISNFNLGFTHELAHVTEKPRIIVIIFCVSL